MSSLLNSRSNYVPLPPQT